MNPNLVSTLDTTPDLTVFAPSNMAFQSISSVLQNISMSQLTSVLGYHVINGTVAYSSTLTNGTTVPTLSGPNLTITLGDDGAVFVNSARVVTPDVLVANGVVHVIDNVLNPNMTSAMPDPSATMQSAAFAGASSGSMVPFTSGVPTPTSPIGGGMTTTQEAGAGTDTATATAMETGTTGAAMPMRTGAVGVAALFAGAGVWLNA